MPKRATELRADKVSERAAELGMHAVGGVAGLYLVKGPKAKSWILRTMVRSLRRDVGMGAYPEVTLTEARKRAQEAKDKVRKGVDPVLERKASRSALKAAQASAITFDKAVREFLEDKSSEWKNDKHRWQWSATLEARASPVIGSMLVADIRHTHVLQVLKPIWHKRTETAVRIRGRIERVLDWAGVHGYRSGENPASQVEGQPRSPAGTARQDRSGRASQGSPHRRSWRLYGRAAQTHRQRCQVP
jgi:hypothetical protein